MLDKNCNIAILHIDYKFYSFPMNFHPSYFIIVLENISIVILTEFKKE